MSDCVLCYVEYSEELPPWTFPCGHVFCHPCISSLQTLGCPGCRWVPEDPDRDYGHETNLHWITRLFIDFKRTETEVAQAESIGRLGREQADDVADRLRALIAVDDVEIVEGVIEDAKKWIDGLEAIQDVEVKVAIARLQFELSGLLGRVTINQDLKRRATQSEKQLRNLRNFGTEMAKRLDETRDLLGQARRGADERERDWQFERDTLIQDNEENKREIEKINEEVKVLNNTVVEQLALGKDVAKLINESRRTADRLEEMKMKNRMLESNLKASKEETVDARRRLMELRNELENSEMERSSLLEIVADKKRASNQTRTREKELLDELDCARAKAKFAEKRVGDISQQLTLYMTRYDEEQSRRMELEMQLEEQKPTPSTRFRNQSSSQPSLRPRPSISSVDLSSRVRMGSHTFGGTYNIKQEDDGNDLDPMEDDEDQLGDPILTGSLKRTFIAHPKLERRRPTFNGPSRGSSSRTDRPVVALRNKRARNNSPEGYDRPGLGIEGTLKKRRSSLRDDSLDLESE